MKSKIITVFLFCLFLALGGVAMAQESNMNSKNEAQEKTELEKQLEIAKQKKELAEAQKAEAEALNALAKAKLPSTETKGLEGTVTVGANAGYYAEILAYEAMEDGAKEIAEKLKKNLSTGPLIILGNVDLAEELMLWNLLDIKLTAVNTALQTTLGKYSVSREMPDIKLVESRAFLAAAPTILGAAADIAAFFRTDRTITAKAITINEQALIFAVANEIRM